MQVSVHPGLALPLQLHRKGALEAVVVRGAPVRRRRSGGVQLRVHQASIAAPICGAPFSRGAGAAGSTLQVATSGTPGANGARRCPCEPHADRGAGVCRAGADQEQHWFAQLRLVLSCTDTTGARHRLVFLRWLTSTGGAELPLQRLTWATQDVAGGPQRPWYDCQDVDCIERPVLLQPDPEHAGFFYYNHFMGAARATWPCSRAAEVCLCRNDIS